MNVLRVLTLGLWLVVGTAGADEWEPVVAGVAYRQILRDGTDAHG